MIEQKYKESCSIESDIYQHLPKLREYADKCNHITEMGVRWGVSLYAFLSSNASKVIAYDIVDVRVKYGVPEFDKLTLICADILKIEIEQTDFLFIDTAHNYKQLKKELALHADKVNKYIGFHDTETFGINGDDGQMGLMPAIDEFLLNNPEWVIEYQVKFNNGLTIIKRK